MAPLARRVPIEFRRDANFWRSRLTASLKKMHVSEIANPRPQTAADRAERRQSGDKGLAAGAPRDLGVDDAARFRWRRWLLGQAMPAASLLALMLWQLTALQRDAVLLAHVPTWAGALGCLRAGLYEVFLSVPTIAFLRHDPPSRRDDRIQIRAAAVVATFLLVTLGVLAPAGPVLFQTPVSLATASFAVTLVGATLAVFAATTLGMNFSFGPEVRQLVTHGPYRVIRHPAYLAELMMSLGVLLPDPRLTLVVGEATVIGLQVLRIRAEERLLAASVPEFGTFESATRYRLIPGIW
jgi:protein-S-isoprenylcysteine O-methyltransferase Ste14